MPSQSLLQLRAVILHPAPNRSVVDVETTLLQQLLNIAQRERIAKIPPDRTKDEAGFGLPPFEDRRSGSHFAIVSRHQPATLKVATHPFAPRALPRFFAPTRQCAPDRCIGTFSLVGSPLVPFPLSSPTRFSSSIREPGLESRLLYTGHRIIGK